MYNFNDPVFLVRVIEAISDCHTTFQQPDPYPKVYDIIELLHYWSISFNPDDEGCLSTLERYRELCQMRLERISVICVSVLA